MTYIIEYTDGSTKRKWFKTKQEAIMWIHNEGDHVWNFYVIED